MTQSKKTLSNVGQDVEQPEPSFIADQNAE
jgi:hypothetical protein